MSSKFDNVGWARGTKSVGTNWGAYFWILQNRIVFQSSTSEWWTATNGLPIAITNVMVGTLGDYQAMSNVVDIGPSLDGVTNRYLGPNNSDDQVYQVDITNVFYQLSIPDIWITPRFAVTNVGGTNIQYTVTGTNIPQGVTWKIIPEGVGATIQTNADWYHAEVTPGNVGTNYKVRATSKDNTNFYDEVNLTVLKVDIVETNIYLGLTNTTTLHLAPNSSANVQWEITPTVQGGASIVGSSLGTSIVFNAGSVPTNYTVRAYAVDLTNCYDLCAATAIKVEVTNIKFNWDTASSSEDAINIRRDYTNVYDISNGEWVKGVTNIPACYTVNESAEIKARFTVQPAGVTSADIWATAIGAEGSLGDVLKTNVAFSGGVSDYVTFRIFDTMPDCVQKTASDVWQWKMENANGSGSAACNMNTSGVHTVYTILNEPVSPWNNAAGNSLNVWTRVLDKSCLWASGATAGAQILSNIVTQSYSMGVVYDGDVHYTYPGYTQFHLQALIDEMSTTGTAQMDCRDFANWTHTLSGSVGESAQYRVIDRTTSPYYFTYNYILPSGHTNWNTDNWSFHQVGWWNSKVCDASLKLDNDNDPTEGPGDSNHVEKLSIGDMTQTDYLDKLTETPDVADIETGTCQIQ